MSGHIPWPWTESLGGLRPDPGQRVRVKKILFGLVRDRCLEAGLEEGLELRYRSRTADQVVVELPDGQVRDLELPYAWFVQVEPLGPLIEETIQ